MENKALIKKITPFLVILFFVGSGIVFANSEIDFEKEDIFVPSSEMIDDDYFGAAASVDVAGNINGDAMIAGGMLNFSGKSSGDVMAAGGNIIISGKTEGNIRAAGGNIFIKGEVQKNVTIAGGNIVVEKESVINGNLYVAGGNVELRGDVKGKVKIAGGRALISGNIGKDAEIMTDEALIRPDAKIGGNLTYYGDKKIEIDKSIVAGEIINRPISKESKEKDGLGGFLVSKILKFLGLLLLAFVLYRLFSGASRKIFLSLVESNPWKLLAFGIAALISVPVAFIILMITVIGIPLAFVLLAVFAISLVLSKIISYIMVGYFINKRLKPYEFSDKFPLTVFILGFLVIEVLWMIPVLGWLAVCLITVWAFGGIARYVHRGMKIEK